MKTISLYINDPFHNLVAGQALSTPLDYLLPAVSSTSKDMLLQAADILQKNSFRVGLEITLSGLQRPKRLPLTAVKDSSVMIIKVCNDETKIEQTILLMSDLKNEISSTLSENYSLRSAVIYQGAMHSRIESIASELEVLITRLDGLDGLLN